MNYDKFYDKRADGSYVVHFPNGRGLELNELNKIFSAFGKVLSIDNRGQVSGLCFVKYGTLEDVKRCIDGFRHHKFIKILPHKNKMTGLITKKCTQSTKKFNHSSKNDYSSDKFGNNDFYKDEIEDSQLDIDASETSIVEDTNLSDSRTSGSTTIINVERISSLRNLLKVKSLRKAMSNTSISSDTSNKDSKAPKNMCDETEIPALVPADQTYARNNNKLLPQSIKVVPAQEIIVANIHPSLSVHYILHLFEKYNPISVSLMRKASRSGIRYCHVYYKTYEEANATMKEFDTYSLHGKDLIVLTSHKLLEEAH